MDPDSFDRDSEVNIQKTEGIILRRSEIRETSVLLIAYTRDFGKIQGLVKGVRGSRAAVPWVLEPLTLQSLVLYERRRSPWVLVSSCDLVDPFEPILRDLTKISYASYFLDLVDQMTEPMDSHPEIFHLLLSILRALEEGADGRSMARFMETHLLKSSGLLPGTKALPLSPGAKMSFDQILATPFARAGRFRLTQAVEMELRTLLQRLLQRALEKELKSRLFLNALKLETFEALPA